MIENYADSLQAVLTHEGGYVNDPKDPGGATNKGITQHIYDAWRATSGLPLRSVKLIEPVEVEAIYRRLYWDACQCSLLPDGVDYCVFDFAVNSGPFRAAEFLQAAVGATIDGHVGPATLTQVTLYHPRDVVHAICDARVAFLRKLKTFPHFGIGWVRRVTDVESAALVLAGNV